MNSPKRRSKTQTPGEKARLRAGFDLKQAARKLSLCPRYLRQLELHGNAPLKTAKRLATLYNCSGNIFLHTPKFLSELDKTATKRSNPTPQPPMANRNSDCVSAAASSSNSNVRHSLPSPPCFLSDGDPQKRNSDF